MVNAGSWTSQLFNIPIQKKNVPPIKVTSTISAYDETTSITSSPIFNTTEIKQTTEHMTTYMYTIHSSMMNTTGKHLTSNRNKILISLLISLVFISLCIGLSYCLFIYFNHYLNMKSITQQDKFALQRTSFLSLTDSNSDTSLPTCKMENGISSKTIDKHKDTH